MAAVRSRHRRHLQWLLVMLLVSIIPRTFANPSSSTISSSVSSSSSSSTAAAARESPRNVAIVTYLDSEDQILPARVMLQSFKDNANLPSVHTVVVYNAEKRFMTQPVIDALKRDANIQMVVPITTAQVQDSMSVLMDAVVQQQGGSRAGRATTGLSMASAVLSYMSYYTVWSFTTPYLMPYSYWSERHMDLMQLMIFEPSIYDSAFDQVIYLAPETLVIGGLDKLYACRSEFCAVYADNCEFDTHVMVFTLKDGLATRILQSYADEFAASASLPSSASVKATQQISLSTILNVHFKDLFRAPLNEMPVSAQALWSEDDLRNPYRRLPLQNNVHHRFYYSRMRWELPTKTCGDPRVITFTGPALALPWSWYSYGLCELSWTWRSYQNRLKYSTKPPLIRGYPVQLFISYQVFRSVVQMFIVFHAMLSFARWFRRRSPTFIKSILPEIRLQPISLRRQSHVASYRLLGLVFLSLFTLGWSVSTAMTFSMVPSTLPLSVALVLFCTLKVGITTCVLSTIGLAWYRVFQNIKQLSTPAKTSPSDSDLIHSLSNGSPADSPEFLSAGDLGFSSSSASSTSIMATLHHHQTPSRPGNLSSSHTLLQISPDPKRRIRSRYFGSLRSKFSGPWTVLKDDYAFAAEHRRKIVNVLLWVMAETAILVITYFVAPQMVSSSTIYDQILKVNAPGIFVYFVFCLIALIMVSKMWINGLHNMKTPD